VRYRVDGPLRGVVLCHCSRCRRTHGHIAAYAACAASELVLLDRETLRWFDQDGRSRGFCAACGASLFWREDGGATVSVSAGTLDPPTGLRTIAQIYTDSRGDYYELQDLGRRFGGTSGGSLG
jgi:hypothetical protein